MMQEFTLTIERVELRTRDAWGLRPAWQTGERYSVYQNVIARDATGRTTYFDTPGVEMRVTLGGPVAVVTYDPANDWIQPRAGLREQD
jgi:hypothetical protein